MADVPWIGHSRSEDSRTLYGGSGHTSISRGHCGQQPQSANKETTSQRSYVYQHNVFKRAPASIASRQTGGPNPRATAAAE